MTRFVCAHQDKCDEFSTKFEPVLETITHAHKYFFDLLTETNEKLDSQEKTVVWLLSAACLKEFEELLLLCGNGYGTGATKLLRAFYERVITTTYLAQNQDKIQQFIDYSDIHWKKLLIEAEDNHADFYISDEARQRIEANYQTRKQDFEEEVCPKCHKMRIQQSWTKAGVPTLAQKVAAPLRLLCFNAYLAPTFHLHTTFWGILNLSRKADTGGLSFLVEEVQNEAIQENLENAHLLLLQALETLHDSFGLNKNAEILAFGEQWKASWEKVH